MKSFIKNLTNRILKGEQIKFEEAVKLINIDKDNEPLLEELFTGANQLRKKFAGNKVNMCTIINAKSGSCSENCKFCAQSTHYNTDVDEFDLINYEEILEKAKKVEKKGAHRFSLVTSGKKLTEGEFEKVISIYETLSEQVDLDLCASHGEVTYKQALALKKAGVKMYHHNLETSKDYYNNICTTHTFEDRIKTIKNILKADLDICCGGIIGLGESKKDRIKMAFEIKDLGIKSIPVNVLSPIPGTPLEKNSVMSPEEILKTMAVYRYILPDGSIRYAGGRSALKEKQDIGLRAGINGMLVGDFLTTVGSNIKEDKKMIKNKGLEI